MHRGFILQSTYRIEGGKPVVFVYGKLESGQTFLVRDTRHVPYFHVRSVDCDRARALGAVTRPESPPRTTFEGELLVRVEVEEPRQVPALRDRLLAAGIECMEADVPFATRYLIDRGIRGSVDIIGEPQTGDGVGAVFDDPETIPGNWSPTLSVLSFDIETDPKAARLLSIALAGCGIEQVLLFTPEGYERPKEAVSFRSEKRLLEAFVARVRDLDPDILTGWNVVAFDLAVLLKVAARTGVPMTLGRGQEPLRLRQSTFARVRNQATLPGRVVLDGIELLRGAFIRLESYSLEAASQEILGRGKTIAGPDRSAEIITLFKRDRARLVEYNLNDARLVIEILDRLALVPLAVERSRLTGMPLDRVGASVASFDFLYLSALAKRGKVAPSARPPGQWETPTSGGHVLEPLPGLYQNVLVFDFRSLYPSIIRTFQIDPLGYVPSPGPNDDPIMAPNGAAFRREKGILPGILDGLVPRRAAAAAAGDRVASHAIKILMNSFYGVLGTPACRFAAPNLANAITGFGRELLLWSRDRMESYGTRVLYGDTDSLFVLSGVPDAREAGILGTRIADRLNRELSEHILKSWRVESRLELRFERLFLRFFLPHMRHGTAGARKRYAGLVQGTEGPEVVFTGMEAVRRDWTDLAKQVQREIYLRLFTDRPLGEYLKETVGDLRAGKMDALLVYRKAIRKNLDAYAASTPPHVAAARKSAGRHGSLVSYLITRNGPEPAETRQSPIDYEHYVQKQIRAVCEPVLAVLGLDFNRVIGDDPQLKLFL